jgi:N-carbamoyl-L-amino-acid hydrolase
VKTSAERISRFKPVLFDGEIVDLVEKAAAARGLSCRKMTSGAGQDAQNMALICPTAMIFVPSVNGISHNPDEFSREEDLIAGANVLLDVISSLAGA